MERSASNELASFASLVVLNRVTMPPGCNDAGIGCPSHDSGGAGGKRKDDELEPSADESSEVRLC